MAQEYPSYDAVPVSLNGFTMFRFRSLDSIPGLRYGIFGRSGGVSQAPYSSLNVAFSTGDSQQNVLKNIELVRQELGFPLIASCNQVHGTKLVILDEQSWRRFRMSSNLVLLGDGDGMVTNLSNVALMVKTGDCQAIILVDQKHHVIANIHCGWRGNVQNIAGLAVNAMERHFGSNPHEIIAAVSPSLGPCCAEFVHYKREIPEAFWRFKIGENHFDLWAITTYQLVEAGLKPYNIHVSGWCTRCHPKYFFSYRREKLSGRMAVVAGWKE
jgi:YfiH family protein